MTVTAVNNLKYKFINDFDKFRKNLYKGYLTDYRMLIQEIAVIEQPDYFEERIYQYLMSL